MSSLFSWIFVMIQRTVWNSNINSPLIPWSVNPFLQYKSSIFGNFHLKWYILHSFKGWRRFMLWALTKNRSILRPFNSDFLLTTTFFMKSNERNGCVFTQTKYSGHSGLKISRFHICTYWRESSWCSSLKTIFKIRNMEFQHLFFITINFLRLDRSILLR